VAILHLWVIEETGLASDIQRCCVVKWLLKRTTKVLFAAGAKWRSQVDFYWRITVRQVLLTSHDTVAVTNIERSTQIFISSGLSGLRPAQVM
jgi:hypothetical protein